MFKDEGYKLMGAAFEVYNHLGYGMADCPAARRLLDQLRQQA